MDTLERWWQHLNGNQDWVLQVFAVIFITLLANFIAKKFYDRLEIQFSKTKNLWDDALLWAVRKPSRAFMLIIGTRMAAEIMEPMMDESINNLVKPAFLVMIISVVLWFVIRMISKAEELLKTPGYTQQPLDETTVTALAKLLRLSVIITGGLVIAQSMGISVSGVLAFGGIGGIAVGFAAKDLLANFFGGLMVYLDRPFSVGDWVRSPDRNIEGTIEHIGWRLTVIRTFDKRPLYVPNSTFTSIALENPSRMSHRRIYETMGVRYDDVAKLPSIVSAVKAMLAEHPEVDHNQTLIVNFNQYGASSLDFFIYCMTVTTNWVKFHEVKQDVLFKVAEIVQEHGAEFAFPTQTLHVIEGVAQDSRTVKTEEPA
ncbi:mechanosensitive ion channel family protein [Ketobacter alkanivorans]|uniref:Mechanosensitive ion channel protein MscS n=1 Tax=Ketobacter alkanivorans TaxID=1917421 RepID=A0A2K9LIY8_9GAMM|nr:mechanosensitive ion channel family protein [Ketobacter alkanivorans]AUM11455.1 mechanosensitive ion channel protein MscS [Ketobacter alkanivorans]MCP5019523.1 mechanosensitive ion channel family protein [Ketobacter sp.]